MQSVTLTIPCPPPPSLNVYARMHWTRQRRLVTEWAKQIAVVWHRAGRPRFARAEVHMRYYYAPRRGPWDDDNLLRKPLLDALVRLGVLADDSAACITAQSVTRHRDTVPRVQIDIVGEPDTAEAAEARSLERAKRLLGRRKT